ncbi:MAG: exonuclease domain-containing protein [Proteobacteria bacterium]|nr:exonuclease domain-containing protein [Pseudomonadota bacterium]
MSSSEYVFIDLETTGISEKKDRIIEIGAVKVNSLLEPVDKFHTLVKPGISVPYAISILTHGLNDEMLKNAPSINDIRDEFLKFIGDAPLIAHNATFEEAFLKAQIKKDLRNPFMDTMELFSLFFPAIGSLKLDNLIKKTGVRTDGEKHRAFEDAEDMYKIVLYVKNKMKEDLNYYVVAQRMLSFFRKEEWLWSDLIKGITPAVPPKEKSVHVEDDEWENNNGSRELKFSQVEVDAERLFSLITPPLDQRPEQHEYIKYIANSFNNNSALMIEAGTGTGKTLAYLLPALQWAVKNSGSVIVSTKTKILQQQILDNDFPLAKQLLDNNDIKALKVQGRNNYLCIRKMDRFFADIDLIDDFESKYSKLFFFAFDKLSDGGNFTNIPIWVKTTFPHVYRMLDVLCADSSNCHQSRCTYYNDCHYFSMAKCSKKAHLMITNHALMMNWPAHLPKGDKIIFDEAHNLQKEATEATTMEIDSGVIANLIFILHDEQRGKGVISALKKMGLDTELLTKLEATLLRLKDYDVQFKDLYEKLFVKVFASINKRINQDYAERLILFSPTLVYGQYDLAKSEEWKECSSFFSDTLQAFKYMNELLTKVKEAVIDKEYVMIIESLIEKLGELGLLLEQTLALSDVDNLDNQHVFWLTLDYTRENWTLSRALVDVGNVLAADIYPNFSSAVFTSATMKAGNKSISEDIGFDRITTRVISDDVISIPSPFDYKKHSMMVFMNDSMNAWENNFVPQLSSTICDIANLLGGKTLILFSNIRRLYACYDILAEKLAPKGFKILRYDLGSDVINYFTTEPKAILLGSESFGEGLDIRGEALSCVILERMPVMMKVPMYMAREDLYKIKHKVNPYLGYELPQRLLKLRQWSGRLIRSKTDKGVVLVYDKWFSSQRPEIRQNVMNAVFPMPVVTSSVKDVIDGIKARYRDWGYDV